jgi:hypothetical protein
MKNTDKSSLFWVVTRHMMVVSDVSVQPVGPNFRDVEAIQEDGKDGPSRNVIKNNHQHELNDNYRGEKIMAPLWMPEIS